MIGTSEKSVRRGHQRVAMKTLRTYFSELVYGELQSPIGSRLLHRRDWELIADKLSASG